MFRVTIVGRPNVGKSTLFNKLTRSRRAIVGNEPGITRDRLVKTARRDGKQFEVVDTGGLVPGDQNAIARHILEQASLAMKDSDLLLLVVDVREGITPLDEDLNSLLRSRGKEYLLVVNKVDAPKLEDQALEFYALGVDEIFPVSAEHKLGIEELLERILDSADADEQAPRTEEIATAIVGRPNVGKSSLLNRLLGEQRAIVTDIPGTTRDAVDSLLEFEGACYRLIDTAGIRRKGRTELMAEKLAVVMARKSMERAQIVLLVIDADQGVSRLDATIGGYAQKAGCSVIVVVNKWDLVDKDSHTAARLEKEFRSQLRFLDFAPLLFVSARTGQRVERILGIVKQAHQARRLRIPTSELNDFLHREAGPRLESAGSGRKFPVKFAAQVSSQPPTFVLFTRSSARLHFSTRRFLINRLRDRYDFFAAPIRIVQRAGSRRKPGSGR